MSGDLQQFEALLASPDTRLEDVLLSPSLTTAVRSELSSLFEYLSHDEIISQLSDFCLTSKYLSHPEYAKLSTNAVTLFLETTMNIFEFLLDSPALSESLHNFLLSEDSSQPRYCGHFSRILASQIRWGTPSLFTSYEDSISLLMNRIEILAIQDFIVLVVLSADTELINTQDIIAELTMMSESHNNQKSQDALQCLLQIFASLTPDSDLFIHFCHPDFVSSILKTTLGIKSMTLITDLVKMLINIQKVSPESIIFTDEQKDAMTLKENNITTLSIAAIPLIFNDIKDVFVYFFCENAHPFLHHQLCQLIDEYDICQLSSIAKLPNFIDNLINYFQTDKWCPHMMKLAWLFCMSSYSRPIVRARAWKEFVFHQFLSTLQILEFEYGGHISNIEGSDSDGSDSEDDRPISLYLNWSEEEEEEEDYARGDAYPYYDADFDLNKSEENDQTGELEIQI